MSHFRSGLQRQSEIEDMLLQLMTEMPFEEITVKDLTQRLSISRKAYYRYFPNKQSCLESLTDRIILDCNTHLMKTVPESASLYDRYAERLRFWMAHKEFLDAIIRNKLDAFLVNRCLAYYSREDRDLQLRLATKKTDCDEDILFFYLSGEISLLLKWCREGFTLSIEEMVKKEIRLVHEPLLPMEQ